MILFDTNVLSLIFRRNDTLPEEIRPLGHRLGWLVATGRAAVLTLVVQELLTGLRHTAQFERLQARIRLLPVLMPTLDHHIAAAKIANQCIQHGVSVHVTDALLAAVAIECGGCVLTEDQDFSHMAPLCGVRTLSVDAAIRMTTL